MDEHFQYFLDKFGPADRSRPVADSDISAYRGRLPDQLLAYWQEFGWSSYARGLLTTVDPDEYEPVVEAWLGGTDWVKEDDYHAVARSAFGELYLLGSRHGSQINIVPSYAWMTPPWKPKDGDANKSTQILFATMNRESNDMNDVDEQPLFERAVQRLGVLEPDEIYGFAPALALGGIAKLERLERVKAIPHLMLLSQLSPLRLLNFE